MRGPLRKIQIYGVLVGHPACPHVANTTTPPYRQSNRGFRQRARGNILPRIQTAVLEKGPLSSKYSSSFTSTVLLYFCTVCCVSISTRDRPYERVEQKMTNNNRFIRAVFRNPVCIHQYTTKVVKKDDRHRVTFAW